MFTANETSAGANRFFSEIDGGASSAVIILAEILPVSPVPKGGKPTARTSAGRFNPPIAFTFREGELGRNPKDRNR